MKDAFDLERFVAAQEVDGCYDRAVDELRAGFKSGHWMWFVFPQIKGLGQSPVSRRYAISSLAEAAAFLDHPVLGPRLRECALILSGLKGRSADQVFGSLDAMKLRSSMTLFHRAAPADPLFGRVLTRFFDGIPDHATDALLAGAPA